MHIFISVTTGISLSSMSDNWIRAGEPGRVDLAGELDSNAAVVLIQILLMEKIFFSTNSQEDQIPFEPEKNGISSFYKVL